MIHRWKGHRKLSNFCWNIFPLPCRTNEKISSLERITLERIGLGRANTLYKCGSLKGDAESDVAYCLRLARATHFTAFHVAEKCRGRMEVYEPKSVPEMEDFIPTRVSRLKKNAPSNFVSVQYEAPKRKEKVNSESIVTKVPSRIAKQKDKEIDPKREQELEMKKIRYEVIKFGMSGFQKTKAKEAKVALAISLGAKAKKNRKMNYKKLKDLRQKERKREERSQQVSGLTKSLVKHKKPKKKKSDGILDVYGKVEEPGLGKSRR